MTPAGASAIELLSARDRLETEIERLIGLLDTIDGDPDLEPYLAGFDGRRQDDREGVDIDSAKISDLELDGESDGLQLGEADHSDLDSGWPIAGGAYYL